MVRIPVTRRALIGRIKRHLKRDGRELRGVRGVSFGHRYYVVKDNEVVRAQVDPEAFGRELGVLLPFEELSTRNPGSDSGERRCPRCQGCGKIANSDSGEPWTYWEEIPPPSNLAVQMGIVKPIVCPKCGGTGKEA